MQDQMCRAGSAKTQQLLAALLHDSVAARFRKFLSGFLKYFSETDAIIKLNHCFARFQSGSGGKVVLSGLLWEAQANLNRIERGGVRSAPQSVIE